jgi:hypothetical protein
LKQHILSVLGLLALLAGCARAPEQEVRPAFYHWKTHFAPPPAAAAALTGIGAQRLYVKYFDVDWSEDLHSAVPMAKVQWDVLPDTALEVVPTIYITNRCWQHMAPADADTLAEMAMALVQRLHPAGRYRFPEIQIDADWSRRTRDTYFLFLRRIKQLAAAEGQQVSATLRMHQVKYRDRAGIPPVDRCMLMLYNTGDLDDPKEQNSILAIEDLRLYLGGMKPYPLALDLALPIFRWGVLLRGGRPIRLLNQLDLEELAADPRRQKTGPSSVKVTESHYLRGHYLYPGDILRVEEIAADQLLECVRYAAQELHPHPLHISFYHLEESCIASYDTPTLVSYLDVFRQPLLVSDSR